MEKGKSQISEFENYAEVDSGKVPLHLLSIQEESFLEAYLYPITKETFLKSYFRKKALVIRSEEVRVSDLAKEWLFNLDLEKML